jgi:hypothetical protein
MNHKIVLSLSVLLLLAGLPAALFGQRESSQLEITLRQQVDTEMLNLQRNISVAFELPEKFENLNKSLHIVKELRARSPVQFSDDEIYLEKITSSLESIPKKKNFSFKQCKMYRKQMNRRSKYKAVRRIEALAVNQALPVLESLCSEPRVSEPSLARAN